jgi:integrase/recombinase XerC
MLVKFTATDAWQIQFNAILSILYGTGCTIEEASRLLRSDFNVASKETATLHLGFGANDRTVLLPAQCAELVALHVKVFQGGSRDPLFRKKRGGPIGSVWINLELAVRSDQVGLRYRVTSRTLRRACARHLLEAGINVEDVARFMGLQNANNVMTLAFESIQPARG